MKRLILFWACLVCVVPCSADLITVDDDGLADFNNIQGAVDWSWHGDTVVVHPGTYGEYINLYGKQIVVRSTDPNDPGIVDCTIIDGGATGNVVTFDSGETNLTVLEGFTIRNGNTGIYCYYSDPLISKNVIKSNKEYGIECFYASPTVTGCSVKENSGGGDLGYGIYECGGKIVGCQIYDNAQSGLYQCSGPVSDCTIRGNLEGLVDCQGPITNCQIFQNAGAGIANADHVSECIVSGNHPGISASNVTITKCLISGNRGFGIKAGGSITNTTVTGNFGHGVESWPGQSLVMLNCTISANRLNGIEAENATSVKNCIITGNLDYGVNGSATLRYNNIWGNQSGSYSNLPPGETDIHTPPFFASDGHWVDPCGTPGDANDDVWVDGDYHLRSEKGRMDPNSKTWVRDGVTSHCIDAGDPCDPTGDEPYPNGAHINQGAYGGTAEASKSPSGHHADCADPNSPADVSGDCKVDLDDFAVAASHWLETVKAKPNVIQEWAARYNGPGDQQDQPKAMTVDESGNIYVTGDIIQSDGRTDLGTIKYHSNGNELWVADYNGPADSYYHGTGIAVDILGNVYVTGYGNRASLPDDYITVKYDANGNELWAARYDGPDSDWDAARAMAIDNTGNVYVTGESGADSTGYDFVTIKYDPDGNEVWVARYNGPDNDWDAARAVAIDESGNVYVTGESVRSETDWDFATIKYDADGNEVWVARYNGPDDGWDVAHAVAVDAFGNVYVTGESWGVSTLQDYATIKYDPNGSEVWVARYNGPGNSGDWARAMAINNSGNMYVTGESGGAGTEYDYLTIKYDANGNEVWVARYNAANYEDEAEAIAIDNWGNIYVTGNSWAGGGTGPDYATIKYDANGNEVWVARYDGPGNGGDWAYAIAIDPSGNVYVTGNSEGSDTSGDYATIKYSPKDVCVTEIAGDFNGDCKVNLDDLAILADHWLDCYVDPPEACW